MAWTCDEAVAVLGEFAQVVPGGIIVNHLDEEKQRNLNVLVATLVGDVFSVTPEGVKILEEFKAAAAPKKLGGVKKSKVADDAPASTEDIDLS